MKKWNLKHSFKISKWVQNWSSPQKFPCPKTLITAMVCQLGVRKSHLIHTLTTISYPIPSQTSPLLSDSLIIPLPINNWQPLIPSPSLSNQLQTNGHHEFQCSGLQLRHFRSWVSWPELQTHRRPFCCVSWGCGIQVACD